MVQAVVTTNLPNSLGFGKIFNFTPAEFQATSTAAFRPRDICVILDFSGSMRFSSLLGTPYSGNNRSCNNQDTVVPTFGQYSSGYRQYRHAGRRSRRPYGNANISITSADGRPPVIPDFYANSSGTRGLFRRPVELCHDARRRRSRQEQLGNQRRPTPRPSAQVLNISSPGNSTYNSTFETKAMRA